MAVTNYYSVGGWILGECTNGVETTYMSDSLGSTIGTVTSVGLQNRYVYSPYGSLLGKSGTAADPQFLWNGRSGYRATGRNGSEEYVRRRHVGTATAQWTTRDPLWPRQRPYGYVRQRPAAGVDPSGRQ